MRATRRVAQNSCVVSPIWFAAMQNLIVATHLLIVTSQLKIHVMRILVLAIQNRISVMPIRLAVMRIQIAVMRNGFRVMRILIVEVRKPAVVSQMCVAMPPTCMGSDAKLVAAARIALRMPQSERGVRPPA